MSLISSSIPNFVNGVSQQPFTLRLSSQGEVQENALSTASSGMRKRPPTEHLAKIGNSPVTDAFVHLVSRDDTEKYQVVITNGNLQVFDLAGVPKTVTFTNQAYLNTALPVGKSFAVLTVADYTFIVNRSKVVAASTAVSPVRPYEAMISVKQGAYGKTYSVSINGTVQGSFTTPDGLNATTDTPKVATDYIAQQLFTALTTAGFAVAPWTLTRQGSVLILTRQDSVDFGISCEDGQGGNAMVALKGQLQKFTDLPANPRQDGFTIEIVGDAASDFDNYWVAFDSNTAVGSGVWRETIAPGTPTGLDATSMPHQLIRNANGTFTFQPAVWDKRKVGDIESNPNPSLIGRKINDVFFFQNRLGFLSDENYIQSETGSYFNLFRTTVTTLLDSDPVDVNAATNKVAVLEHAISYNRQLLLFSAQQQFVVDGAQLMSPKKVPIKPATDFVVNMGAKPVACGRNVYFTTDKGNWSAVREFFAQDLSVGNDATDISAHVPKYIPSNVVKIASGASEDTLVLLSANDRSKLHVYRFYFSGNEKLQSSWSVMNFNAGSSILNCDFVGSTLILVVSRASGLYLEKIDFSLGAAVAGEPYHVLLDRKVQVPTSALTFNGTHTVIAAAAVGYVPTDGSYMTVAHGGGLIKPGQLSNVIYDGAIKIAGNFTASALSFGAKYLWRYTLSKLVVRSPSPGGGIKVETGGRTQVRTVSFSYSDTGYFKVLVTPEARQAYTYTFAGKLLGTPSSEIGGLFLPTGTWQVPVMTRNTTVDITLESDMPLPVAILSADWEAFFVKRSQSV